MRTSKDKVIIIVCTLPNKNIFNDIKKIFFTKKLISCINIINKITSYYYWNGKLEKTQEIKVLLKSFLYLEKKIYKIIKNIHPYKIPEIFSLKVNNVNNEYYKWMKKEIINK